MAVATEVITTAIEDEDSLVSLTDNKKGLAASERAASPIGRVKNAIGSTITVGAVGEAEMVTIDKVQPTSKPMIGE